MLIPFGVFSAAGAGETNSFELISTTLISTNTASVSFSSLPSGYKHLQARIVSRDSSTFTGSSGTWFWANSDTGTNYTWHRLVGRNNAMASEGTTSTTRILAGIGARNGDTANIFGVTIVDFLDFANTSKFKTIKALSGNYSSSGASGSEVELNSGVWLSTSAITTINFSTDNFFMSGSRFSLYGIKG